MRCRICDHPVAEWDGKDFLCSDCLDCIWEVVREYDDKEDDEVEDDEDALDLSSVRE